ncbi:MAG: hypothetical protein JNM27_13540 [Leptospirales bacterium]|nr:hypothetical protein [Leptospirales bacterium]
MKATAILRFAVLLLVLAGSTLHAEVVLLRNGQSLTGRVIGQTMSEIEISTNGTVRRIPKRDVLRIQYVPFTEAQKQQALESARKKQEAQLAEWARIQQANMAEAERQKRIAELESTAKAEKEKEAKERADRAAALRELVSKGQMEKPEGEPISYWDFAWRSLVVPGWGHFYLSRPVFGAFYLAGTAGLLGHAIVARRRGISAVSQNRRDVNLNFLLSLSAQTIPLETRTAYAYYSNARAYGSYKKKTDNANRALYALGTFYGVQVAHIIYNGIAWENGLLIVDAKSTSPGFYSIQPILAVGPETRSETNVTGRFAQLALVYSF